MKILLIYPPCLENRIHTEDVAAPPMGLYYIGALLRENGYDAEIVNLQPLAGHPEEIEALLRGKAPDVVGFSVLNANRWGALEAAKLAKKLNPSVTVVFGGVAATYLGAHFLTHFPEVDYIVIGEGEKPFLELVGHLDGTGALSADAIPSIAFREESRIRRTEAAAPLRNLDDLPNPARHFTYQHLALTRGCPSACSFCGSPAFWGRRVRFHSADYFVDQMEMLHNKGLSFFYVSDDVFTLRPGLVIEICQKILQRNLEVSWAAISRVDCVDEKMLRWMRMAGCQQISYGVESGDPGIRKVLNKEITDAAVGRAFALTTRYGILPRAYFIYGCPGETDATIDATIRLIEEIRPLSAIFYILDLFPGTALFEAVRRNLGWTDEIWLQRIEDILYFEIDPNLDRETILAFGKRLRTAFHQGLPRFVAGIELAEDPSLHPYHADFLSRLGMTFSHGDYAQVEAIPDKEGIAETLFRRALAFAPDHRAYLGTGIVLQKRGDHAGSVEILSEGLGRFPHSRQLAMCLGISRMNLAEYEKAAACFHPFEDDPDSLYHLAECYKRIGRPRKAAEYLGRFHAVRGAAGGRR